MKRVKRLILLVVALHGSICFAQPGKVLTEYVVVNGDTIPAIGYDTYVIKGKREFANKKKELYNSLGQLLFTTNPDSYREIIDMTAYAKGIYYLKCEHQVVKVVVE